MRSSTPAQPSKPSRTPLDVLVGLQRADGSWELTGELALVLGTTRSRLQAANVRAATHRCWATALAIAWLRRHGADRGHEWALLARKAAAWLDDRAGAAEAAALIRAAAVVCGSADTNRVQVAGSTQS